MPAEPGVQPPDSPTDQTLGDTGTLCGTPLVEEALSQESGGSIQRLLLRSGTLWEGSSWPVCLQGDGSLSNVLLPGEGQPTTTDRPLAHQLPQGLLYAFPAFSLLHPLLQMIQLENAAVILVAPNWPHMPCFSGVAFRVPGLPDPVIQTWARAPSACVAYVFRWGKFASWCEVHQVDPLISKSQYILQLLQEQLDQGKSAATQDAHRQTVQIKSPMMPPWDLECWGHSSMVER